eukprot:GDKH01023796.1.p1 GENE.GDKH01023796.1~~GDKH01023796.1.p1  ORF type:complete len:140 (+),score=34.50 GDKH01023796.1:2-421(+)
MTVLEHTNLNMINLELATKYASRAWPKHIPDIDAHVKTLVRKNETGKADLDEVHKRRKIEQVSFGTEMRALQQEHESVLAGNMAIANAIHKAEDEIDALRLRCIDAGVQLPDHLATGYSDEPEAAHADGTNGVSFNGVH